MCSVAAAGAARPFSEPFRSGDVRWPTRLSPGLLWCCTFVPSSDVTCAERAWLDPLLCSPYPFRLNLLMSASAFSNLSSTSVKCLGIHEHGVINVRLLGRGYLEGQGQGPQTWCPLTSGSMACGNVFRISSVADTSRRAHKWASSCHIAPSACNILCMIEWLPLRLCLPLTPRPPKR